MHCITLAKERKEGKRWFQGDVLVAFSLSTLYCTTVDWSFATQIRQWERMLFSVEQEFVGRDEKWAPLKTSAWEAMLDLAWLYYNYIIITGTSDIKAKKYLCKLFGFLTRFWLNWFHGSNCHNLYSEQEVVTIFNKDCKQYNSLPPH